MPNDNFSLLCLLFLVIYAIGISAYRYLVSLISSIPSTVEVFSFKYQFTPSIINLNNKEILIYSCRNSWKPRIIQAITIRSKSVWCKNDSVLVHKDFKLKAIRTSQISSSIQGYNKKCFIINLVFIGIRIINCLLYTSPSPRDGLLSRMPSSA